MIKAYVMHKGEETMQGIVYTIISIIIMIITMIYTKSSPMIVIDILASVISAIFPIVDYIQMSVSEACYTGIFIGILSEWFLDFINCFLEDKESKIYVWLGNTFIVLSISMLSGAMDSNMTSNLAGLLFLLVLGYIMIIVIVGFIKDGMSFRACGIMLKRVYINPISTGFVISSLRLVLPALIMLICIWPLTLIPIKVIQIIGAIVIVLLGYYMKQFSDNLIDKIDHNENTKFVRFIVASGIIIIEIMLLQGYTFPTYSG